MPKAMRLGAITDPHTGFSAIENAPKWAKLHVCMDPVDFVGNGPRMLV